MRLIIWGVPGGRKGIGRGKGGTGEAQNPLASAATLFPAVPNSGGLGALLRALRRKKATLFICRSKGNM